MTALALSHLEFVWEEVKEWYIAEHAAVTEKKGRPSAYFPHQWVSSVYNKDHKSPGQFKPGDPLTLQTAEAYKRVRGHERARTDGYGSVWMCICIAILALAPASMHSRTGMHAYNGAYLMIVGFGHYACARVHVCTYVCMFVCSHVC